MFLVPFSQLKDVGGREVLVRFSAEMNPKRRKNLDTMNSLPMRTIYYEGPHKLYVGNLSKFTIPEDLRQLFGRFGNVTSVRVLQDTRQGKQRVYAFVSYLSERERNAALSLNGTVYLCILPLPLFIVVLLIHELLSDTWSGLSCRCFVVEH